MEVRETNFKRFIAGEGMALRWKQSWIHPVTGERKEDYSYTPKEVVLDANSLEFDVEEIPLSQYDEETSKPGMALECNSPFHCQSC